MGENSGASVIFILLFYVFVLIPCVGVSIIGVRLINKLGRFPSKTPSVQMSVLFQLIVLEVVSFTLILSFFKVLTAD